MCAILTTSSSHGKKYILSFMEKERKNYKYLSIFYPSLSLHWKKMLHLNNSMLVKNMWLDNILLIDHSLIVFSYFSVDSDLESRHR